MNKLLLLVACITFFSSCSQRQFAFRQKIKADRHRKEKTEQADTRKKTVPDNAGKPELYGLNERLAADSATETVKKLQEQHVLKDKKALQSASAIKEIIPFALEHLSREEPSLAPEARKQGNSGGGDVLGYVSLVFGILSIVTLLSLVFISSNMLGVIFLFLAPVLAAIALISGIISVSNQDGHGVGWAGVVMGSFILLVTLIMVMIAYLFIQSSIT